MIVSITQRCKLEFWRIFTKPPTTDRSRFLLRIPKHLKTCSDFWSIGFFLPDLKLKDLAPQLTCGWYSLYHNLHGLGLIRIEKAHIRRLDCWIHDFGIDYESYSYGFVLGNYFTDIDVQGSFSKQLYVIVMMGIVVTIDAFLNYHCNSFQLLLRVFSSIALDHDCSSH